MAKDRPRFFYGWVVVTIGFLTIAVVYGARSSFPVFYVAILEEFGWSRADTALIYSINIIVYGLTAPLAGWAFDRLGPRKLIVLGGLLAAGGIALSALTREVWQLYIFFGVILSTGMAGCGLVPNTTLACRWFIKRRATAMGIMYLGFAVSFLIASGVERVIVSMGWRNTFVLLGIIAVAVVPLIAIFQRMDPREKGLLPDNEAEETALKPAGTVTAESLIVDRKWANEDWTVRKVLKTRRFWFLMAGIFTMWGIGQQLLLTHQVAFAVDQGYSRAFGTLIYSMFGLFYGMGNLTAFLSDRFGREVAITAGLVLVTTGTLMLVLNQGTSTPGLMYTYGVVTGLGFGIIAPSVGAAAADLFQGSHFGAINGIILLGFAVGGAFSPWLGGRIYDVMGTYIPAFYFVIACFLVSIAFFWLAGPRQVRLVAGKASRVARVR